MTRQADSYQSDGLKVFLCHRSKDKKVIKELHDRLREDGFWPWLDIEAIPHGQRWEDFIEEAIKGSDAVLICLSRRVNSKAGYVTKEIELALAEAKKKAKSSILLVPVRLEECVIPKTLSDREWTDLFQPDGYEKLASAMRDHAAHTRPSAAIVPLNRFIAKNPGDLFALVNLGVAHGNLGHLDSALQSFDAAIQSNRNFFPAWIERALLLLSAGRKKDALKDFNRAIEIEPEDAFAYFQRGECYAQMDDERRALEDYDHALRINQDLAEAYVARGFIANRHGQHRGAILDFTAAIDKQPDILTAHLWRGHSHHELKMFPEALADFNQAIRIDPEDSYAHQYRARAKQKLNDRAGAQADFAKAEALGYDG